MRPAWSEVSVVTAREDAEQEDVGVRATRFVFVEEKLDAVGDFLRVLSALLVPIMSMMSFGFWPSNSPCCRRREHAGLDRRDTEICGLERAIACFPDFLPGPASCR